VDHTTGARTGPALAEIEAQVQTELEDWKGKTAEAGKPGPEGDADRPKNEEPKPGRFGKFRAPPWIKLK